MATGWTQADIDALRAVIGTGVLTVKYSGPPAREITYQSADALDRALTKMIAAVAAAAGTRASYRVVATKKGFDPT